MADGVKLTLIGNIDLRDLFMDDDTLEGDIGIDWGYFPSKKGGSG